MHSKVKHLLGLFCEGRQLRLPLLRILGENRPTRTLSRCPGVRCGSRVTWRFINRGHHPRRRYHSHPHWQRTESHNRSFFKSALQTAHDLIHIAMLPNPIGTSRARKIAFLGTSLTSVCSAPMVTAIASQPRLEQDAVLNSNLLSDVSGEIPSWLRIFWEADQAAIRGRQSFHRRW